MAQVLRASGSLGEPLVASQHVPAADGRVAVEFPIEA